MYKYIYTHIDDDFCRAASIFWNGNRWIALLYKGDTYSKK